MGRRGVLAVVVVLLAGSAAAFTRTEKLKLDPAPVAKPRFERHLSPGCNCPRKEATLSFLLRRPEQLDAAVVDLDGRRVVTLARSEDFKAGRVSFDWDGRTEDGAVAPDGLYRLRVHLRHDGRTILLPSTIRVDTTAPHIRLVRVDHANGIVVRYHMDEAGKALLLADGKVVARGERHRAGNWPLSWTGSAESGRSGSQELALLGIDQAGNRSAPTTPVPVELP